MSRTNMCVERNAHSSENTKKKTYVGSVRRRTHNANANRPSAATTMLQSWGRMVWTKSRRSYCGRSSASGPSSISPRPPRELG